MAAGDRQHRLDDRADAGVEPLAREQTPRSLAGRRPHGAVRRLAQTEDRSHRIGHVRRISRSVEEQTRLAVANDLGNREPM